MHLALYRKYRPSDFDDVYGQEHITSVLRYEAEHSLFSHAYLFCGPRGTGKTTCAKILSKIVNCENPHNGNPCGICSSCRAIDSGSATDVLEMDAASNTGVDYIRDIKNEVSFAPTSLKKRVYIIDEVHMLSTGAFNALLKTLEEPPEHVVFVLATTEFHKLPATIVSRCQRFDFRRIKSEVIMERLLHISKEEKLPLTEDAARIIAKQSLGGMRDAISLFELCAAGGNTVDADKVFEILGITDIELLYKTAVAVARNDVSSVFSIVQTVEESSKDISVFLASLIDFWRNMLVIKYLNDSERVSYLDLTEPELRLLSDAARRFSSEALTYHFSLLDEAYKDMARLPATKRLTAELTLIKMGDASLKTTGTSLLSRIASLEEKLALLESGVHTIKAYSPADAGDNLPLSDRTEKNAARKEKSEDNGSNEDKTSKIETEQKMELIADIGDVCDKIMAQNPLCAGFLRECDAFISQDGKKVLIRASNDFAKGILSTDTAMQSICSALRICKITEIGAVITVEVGEVKKKKPTLDEIEEL